MKSGDVKVLAAVDPNDGFYEAWCLADHKDIAVFREEWKGHILREITIREAVQILKSQDSMRRPH